MYLIAASCICRSQEEAKSHINIFPRLLCSGDGIKTFFQHILMIMTFAGDIYQNTTALIMQILFLLC